MEGAEHRGRQGEKGTEASTDCQVSQETRATEGREGSLDHMGLMESQEKRV